MALAAAPSIAWNSIRLPPQSITAIATTSLLRSAHAVHASASARAPALEITFTSRVSRTSPGPCPADASPTNAAATRTSSASGRSSMRI
jgi:hypothetical protein